HILLLEGEGGNATFHVVNALREQGYIVEVGLPDNKENLTEYIKRREIDKIMNVDKDGSVNILADLEEI
ncbi:MAG: hypothetical protein M0P14_07850, partial [Alkaliphilus sp.]|nr:hypothetical protein [Alkaliphilus sp.]